MALTHQFDIEIIEPTIVKPKPDESKLGFGRTFSDRMFLREYSHGKWHPGKIVPFEDFSLSPATLVFHYGQAIFEGMKAFKQVDGSIAIFRPDQNAKRFNKSAERLVMPQQDEEYFIETIRKLIELQKDWVPSTPGTSMYVRPTMFASQPILGVKPSEEYLYFVILSPSASYFASGFSPTQIKVEDHYVRAAQGGTGAAKAAGNYAGSLYAAKKAKEEGFAQVLWLDAKELKYVEEVGAMNIAFVIDDEVLTPKPSGTILDSITRRSVMQLTKDLGIKAKETKISIESVIEAIKSGSLTEIFGIGTAASIAPIDQIKFKGEVLDVNKGQVGPISQQLYDELTGIQYGRIEDRHGWLLPV